MILFIGITTPTQGIDQHYYSNKRKEAATIQSVKAIGKNKYYNSQYDTEDPGN
jgi:hypothetical protein